MKSDNIIKIGADILLNDMLFQAMRYCIGRHSYASSYAEDYWHIIHSNFDKFTYDRLMFFAKDIRTNIAGIMGSYYNINIKNGYNDRIVYDPYSLITEYLKKHPETSTNVQFNIDCIAGEVTAGNTEYQNMDTFLPSYWKIDLLPWIRLANCIDRQVEVTCEKDDKTEKAICIQDPDGEYTCINNWNRHPIKEAIKEVTPIKL